MNNKFTIALIFGFASLASACNSQTNEPNEKNGIKGFNSPPTIVIKTDAKSYLNKGVWRVGNCDATLNFQKFEFAINNNAYGKVIVGAGDYSEDLELFHAEKKQDTIIVQTRVCAPVGCNKTYEEYKIINKDTMSEWHFEGRLPDQEPNLVISKGIDKDGNKGRIFNRCDR